MVCFLIWTQKFILLKFEVLTFVSTKIKVFVNVTQGQIGTNISEESAASVLYVERKFSAVN